MENRLGSTGCGPDRCAYCGERLEGRSYQCGHGRVHEDCLDEIHGSGVMLKFAKAFPEYVVLFLEEHENDDFLDGFWKAFGEDHMMEIEGWAT